MEKRALCCIAGHVQHELKLSQSHVSMQFFFLKCLSLAQIVCDLLDAISMSFKVVVFVHQSGQIEGSLAPF